MSDDLARADGRAMPRQRGDRDVPVAPYIWQTWCGWQVGPVRLPGGRVYRKRLKKTFTLEQVEAILAGVLARREETRANRPAAARGTLAADAKAYLKRPKVLAMPTRTRREQEIGYWVAVLGDRPRTGPNAITTQDINAELQKFADGPHGGTTRAYAGGSVNRLATALMDLYTELDGPSAANPVRAAREFPEGKQIPRGRDYALLRRIFNAVPDRGRGRRGVKGSAKMDGSASRARFGLMIWAGLTPAQIRDLEENDFSIEEGWYVSPRRKKGQQPRFPRPVFPKPMTAEGRAAFQRFVALGLLGKPFSRASLRSLWLRAVARVERQMREERNDPSFRLRRVRLYDIRHSYGTAVARANPKNPGVVQLMLDHASLRTSQRYMMAAIPDMLKDAAAAFEDATRPVDGQ